MFNIFCIYPNDKTTSSLNRIVRHLHHRTPISIRTYKVKARPISHTNCLEEVLKLSSKTTIFFFGHGRTNYLYGAVANSFGSIGGINTIDTINHYGYNHMAFIDQTNIDVFKDKKVFSLACNTAKLKGIGQIAVEKGGAKVYLGFGEIPTSKEEIEKRLKLKNIPLRIAERFKGEINTILKEALSFSIANDHTFLEFSNQISFVTNRRAHDIVMYHKKLAYRRLIADMLYLFRTQIRLYGNGHLKLIE